MAPVYRVINHQGCGYCMLCHQGAWLLYTTSLTTRGVATICCAIKGRGSCIPPGVWLLYAVPSRGVAPVYHQGCGYYMLFTTRGVAPVYRVINHQGCGYCMLCHQGAWLLYTTSLTTRGVAPVYHVINHQGCGYYMLCHQGAWLLYTTRGVATICCAIKGCGSCIPRH